jgi:hypothetical protein
MSRANKKPYLRNYVVANAYLGQGSARNGELGEAENAGPELSNLWAVMVSH